MYIVKLSYVNSNSEIPAIKFLGVYIDPKFNFKYHIDAIQSKVSRSLFAINSAKNFINKKALKTLYNSLVHSHFKYCIPIWSCDSKNSIKKLDLLQKKSKSAEKCIFIYRSNFFARRSHPGQQYPSQQTKSHTAYGSRF